MGDAPAAWWMSGDGRWHRGAPPPTWRRGPDHRWYPATPPSPPPPPPPPPPPSLDDRTLVDHGLELPPIDHQPLSRDTAGTATWGYQGWPRWVRVTVPAAAVVVGVLTLGALVSDPKEPTQTGSAAETPTTTETTATRPTTTAPPTTTTSAPPPTTAAPPPTTPPTTSPPATAPPTTAPPAPPPTAAPSPPPSSPRPAGNCHPSYTPCVPVASDVDCEGGRGDGPRYVGRVTVTGPDVYRLDDDDDGIGCE
jgi:hypothetical protein